MSGVKTTLGIDLGTQSIKVLFYDFENRKTLITASSHLDLEQDSNGKAEQQAHWWVSALCQSLEKIPSDIKQSVVAISVSGQQHGFVALDKEGKVLAPVKLWCDTSTEKECRQIMQELGGEEACIDISGNKILPGFTASKILHLKNNYPEIYAQLASILLPHDYLNFWLTGERCMEMGDASGTGFLNIKQRQWSSEVLNSIDGERNLLECLPPLRKSNGIIGGLTSEVSQTTGLPVGTPVAIGGGDNMMGAIGTGNLSPGRTSVSLGTSGTVYAYSDKPVIDHSGNISAFCSSNGGWLPLLCTMNCTVSSEIMRSLINVKLEDFDTSIAIAPIGSEGIITLPFFNGERTPNLPKAKGCVFGIDSQNATPSNLLRSAVEGASFALRFGIEEMNRLGVKTDEIVLTGGGANSHVWRQMIADIMAVKVVVMANNEGAAFGAALQAYATYINGECVPSLLEIHYEIDQELSCLPNEEAVSQYNSVYQEYQQMVANVSEFYSSSF